MASAAIRAKPACLVMVFLTLTLIFTPKAPVRFGDTLQVVLPLAGFGCAVASGNWSGYFGRFAALWVTVHASKRGLGMARIAQRPNGHYRGMPSGHTAAATFGASALVHSCLQNAPVLKTIVVLGAAYTAGSRIEADKHDIWQVLAGALLAIAFERGLRRSVFRRLRLRPSPLQSHYPTGSVAFIEAPAPNTSYQSASAELLSRQPRASWRKST